MFEDAVNACKENAVDVIHVTEYADNTVRGKPLCAPLQDRGNDMPGTHHIDTPDDFTIQYNGGLVSGCAGMVVSVNGVQICSTGSR